MFLECKLQVLEGEPQVRDFGQTALIVPYRDEEIEPIRAPAGIQTEWSRAVAEAVQIWQYRIWRICANFSGSVQEARLCSNCSNA